MSILSRLLGRAVRRDRVDVEPTESQAAAQAFVSPPPPRVGYHVATYADAERLPVVWFPEAAPRPQRIDA